MNALIRIPCWQAKQSAIIRTAERLIQPATQQLAGQLSLFHLGEHDAADEDLPSSRPLALAVRVHGLPALLLALLAEFQLGELHLQGGYLLVEFGHGSTLGFGLIFAHHPR
jgi:hypothetical protein